MANDTVDTKVVRMEFDNKQFEKNVKQTTKSLNNLRNSLDFKGVGDGLDKVRLQISTLQIAMTTFVARLTNKLINLGTVIIKSLSIDNIASGWSKFGEKTIAVATMMAQRIRVAGEEITDLAKKTEVVNKLLEKLTWFADETSYSLSDMTNYASKFIAAGVDLDKAVNAMEGIATWSALAGQGTQKASIAMMQLSQAMGRSINRQDWISIQNAGMDMEEFRDKVLETAIALGELRKEGDKFITKTGKKFEKATFTQYFSEGWFTSDVLIETLNKYSAAVDQIYSLASEKGLTASEVIEMYADQLDEFGLKAFKASQEARTFKDVLNSVKDAVASKWMITFENIFGNKDETIKLWTDLSNRLYEVFAESGNFRNNVLSIWKAAKGRNDIFGEDGAFWNLYNAMDSIRLLIKKAWDTIFPISQMEDEDARAKDIARTLKNVTARIKEITKNLLQSESAVKKISTIFENLFSVLKVGLYTIYAIKSALEPIFYVIKQLASKLLNKIISLSGGIENVLSKIQKAAIKLRKVLWSLVDIIDPSGILDRAFYFLKSIYEVVADAKPFEHLRNIIVEVINAFKNSGGTQENLIKIFKGLISAVSILINAFLALVKALNKYVLPILDKVLVAVAKIVGVLSGIVVNVIAAISTIITTINDAIEGKEGISNISEVFTNVFDALRNGIAKLRPILESLVEIFKALIDVILVIPKILESISIKLTGQGIIENFKKMFDSIANILRSFIDFIGGNDISAKSPVLNSILSGLREFLLGIIEVFKSLMIVARSLISALGNLFKTLGLALQKLGEILLKIFTGRFNELSNSQKAGIAIIGILGSLTLMMYMLWSAFYRLINAVNPLGAISEALVDSIDSLRFVGLTKAINTLSNAFLKFSVALLILENLTGSSTKVGLILVTISAFLLGLIYMITSMTDSATLLGKKVSTGGKGIKESASNAINNLSYYYDLRMLIESIGNIMIKIAIAAYVIDKVSPETFWKVFGILSLILGSLLGITLIIAGFSKRLSGSIKAMNSAPYALNAIQTVMKSISIILLSFIIAMKVIEKTSPDAYWKTIGIFAGITAALIALAILVNNFSSKMIAKTKNTKKTTDKLSGITSLLGGLAKVFLAISVMLIAISIAMNAITKSLSALAGSVGSSGDMGFVLLIPLISMIGVLASIVALIIVLSKTVKNLSDGEIFRIGAIMMLISVMLLSIGASMAMVAKNNLGSIIATSVSILAILGSIIGMLSFLSEYVKNVSNKDIIRMGMLLGLFGGMLLIIGSSLAMVAKYPWESIGMAAAAAVVILLALAGAAALIKTAVKNMDEVLRISYVLLAFSVILLSIGRVLKNMSAISPQDIWVYVGALGVLMGTMTYLASYLQKSHAYQSLLVLATSFIMLSGALYLYGQAMKTITISSILGVLMAIVAIAPLAKVAAPGIALLGTSMFNLSTEMLKLGAALLLIALAIEKLTGYAGQIASFIDAVTASIIRAMQNVVLGMVELIPKIAVILINGLGTIIGAIINVLNTYAAPLAFALINTLIQVLTILANNISTIIALVGKIVMDLILGVLDILITNISPIMDKVFTLLILIINNIAANLPNLVDAILDLIIALLEMVVQSISKIIKTIISTVIDLLFGVFNAILEAFGQEALDKTEFFNSLKGFLDGITIAFKIVLNIVKQLAPFINKIIVMIMEFISSGWVDNLLRVIVDVLTFVMNILNIIMPILSWIFDMLFNKILAVIDMIKIPLMGVFKLLETIFNVLKPIFDIIQLISDAIAGLLSGKGLDWNGFINQFVELGRNLLKGLVKGFVENIKNIFTAPFRMIGDLFKVIFGIHSPSKVFAEYGEYMIKGLGNGLEKETNREQSRFQTIAKTTLKTFEAALFGNENEYDYVMSIGMDISNVEKQTAKVQEMMSSISSGSNVSTTAYGYNANKLYGSIAASEKANSKVDKVVATTTDNSVNMTNNNTFNITSTDPAEAADEIDKILKKNAIRAKLAKGGI